MRVELYYINYKILFPDYNDSILFPNIDVSRMFLHEFGIVHQFNRFMDNPIVDEYKFSIFMLKYPEFIRNIHYNN